MDGRLILIVIFGIGLLLTGAGISAKQSAKIVIVGLISLATVGIVGCSFVKKVEEKIAVATPTSNPTGTPVPTKEPTSIPTSTPTVTPIVRVTDTPVPTATPTVTPIPEDPKQTDIPNDELFTTTIKMSSTDTLTLHFPKEWEKDANVSVYAVNIEPFEDISVEYCSAYKKKGTTDWIEEETAYWKELYEFEDFAFANELDIEGVTDKSYIFGWDASYGVRYIKMYIAGSLDDFLEINIKDFDSGLTWNEWKEAINLFIVTF